MQVFSIFSPSAFTHPHEVFMGFADWWICVWFIHTESWTLLGSISRSAVLDVLMLTSCFWCLARQNSFIHLFILESLLYTVQMRGELAKHIRLPSRHASLKYSLSQGNPSGTHIFLYQQQGNASLHVHQFVCFFSSFDNLKITLLWRKCTQVFLQ